MPGAASYQGYHIPIFWDWNPERRVNGKGSPKHLTECRGLLPIRAWNLCNLQMLERALMEKKIIKNSGRNKHITIKGKGQSLLNWWRSASFLSNALHPIARPSPIFILNHISKYFLRRKLELDHTQVIGLRYLICQQGERPETKYTDLCETANKYQHGLAGK